MNKNSTEQEIDILDFIPETRKGYYMLIMTFTKLDMVIKLMTGEEHKGVKLHKEIECYPPHKTCIILEEGI